jgi:3-oxoacyl-[acyl-carrier protein] reductase
MELGIAGRTAVIGASTEGLGFATARALAEEGVRVCVTGREAGRVATAVEAIRASVPSARVDGIAADLSTVEGARNLVEAARARLGDVDIVVANVGGPPPGPAQSTDLATLRASLDRCLLAMIELTQGFLPGMRARRWGRILAITSGGVRAPLANMVYSNTSRAGLTAYLKTLARELIAEGVTVNSILPSNQITRRLESLVGDGLPGYLAALPAKRGGDPRDFGRIAAFLCSEPANYLTGVALSVDGGTDPALV